MQTFKMAQSPAEVARGSVFDRAHLDHYVMQNQELAAEVVNLFLAQLPLTLKQIEEAGGEADWRFATHTLKGSAAAVGAPRLQQLAGELEKLTFGGNEQVRLLRVQALKAAAAEFREEARRSFPLRS